MTRSTRNIKIMWHNLILSTYKQYFLVNNIYENENSTDNNDENIEFKISNDNKHLSPDFDFVGSYT